LVEYAAWLPLAVLVSAEASAGGRVVIVRIESF